MLEPDPDERPDIFQVASIAFSLSNRECTVSNTNVSMYFIIISRGKDLAFLPPMKTI